MLLLLSLLDPIGDLREMQKIQCLLKKGGLLFVGITTGSDAIWFNALRMYGRIRLPMMFEDPIGDLRKMQKIQCLLKKGGLLFVGITTGSDAIWFNALRMYGRIRLPMMFEGFKLLNIFVGNASTPVFPNHAFYDDGFSAQPTFVLQRD
uniref:Methyltransf_11 domain-containing protein n=1 Tax=Ascaris lumbricoides TaxID=6252 RepID=A0A0M3INV5_ASCLU